MARTKKTMDIRSINRKAWDHQVDVGNPWTIPVTAEVIASARLGKFSILLTEHKTVPEDWIPPLPGLDVLCLACGGGQQGPILAAAGANVTVFDNSPKQLERDRQVAEREGLTLKTVEGDMRDLSAFGEESYDLIFHPVSNVFIPDIHPVWAETFRVLKRGGVLLSGFMNPVYYLFGTQEDEQVAMNVKYAIPYSDAESLSREELQACERDGIPLEFGHSLSDQIGGQLEAGFLLTGFYEDYMFTSPISIYTPVYIATRALKPVGKECIEHSNH